MIADVESRQKDTLAVSGSWELTEKSSAPLSALSSPRES